MEQEYNDILARFASTRELQAKPFPLKSLLRIYVKNESWCNKNVAYCEFSLYSQYFLGFKKLVNWLGPIEIPVGAEAMWKQVHPILVSYEIQQIAILVGCSDKIVWHLISELVNE